MMREFILKGGPMDGQSVLLPYQSSQLKVVVPVRSIAWDPDVAIPDAVIETRTEFYIRVGLSSYMEFQPHPH